MVNPHSQDLVGQEVPQDLHFSQVLSQCRLHMEPIQWESVVTEGLKGCQTLMVEICHSFCIELRLCHYESKCSHICSPGIGSSRSQCMS